MRRPDRIRHPKRWTMGSLAAGVFLVVVTLPGIALAQLPAVTPNTQVTPSKSIAAWINQMTYAAVALGLLAVLLLLASYLRFAPKFFGREERAVAAPPGARPPLIVRPATRPAPAASPGPPPTPASAAAPTPAPSPAPAPAPAASPAPTEAPTEEAATPSAEPAAEARTEAEAPEAAAEAPAEPAAEAPTEAPVEPAAEAPVEPAAEAQPAEEAPAQAAAPPAPAPASHGSAAGGMDQETFDRVLQEQLDKGVDRRVAEGRARAAAVVAARKKAQG